jgi:polysaccharide chain length determinant protein (PEP-CTERM system associated)
MASGPEAKSSSAKLSKAHASRQHYPEPKGQPGPNPKPEVISGKAPENLKKAEDLTRKDMQTFFEQLPDDHSEPLSKDQKISYEDSSAKSERQSNVEKFKAQLIPETMQTKQPKQEPEPLEDSASAETMGNNVRAATSKFGRKSQEKRLRRGRGPDSTDGDIPGPPAISMRDIFHVVFKRRAQIVLFFAAVFTTVVIGTLLTKPTYESSAQILVKLGRESVFMPATGDSRPIINFDREERINSEIEILSSRALAEKVVAQIGPTAVYPQLADDSPGLLERFFPKAGEELSPEEKTLMRFESAVYGFMNSLAVGAVKKSNIIEIYFSHENPQMAALVVNTLADTYLAHHVSVHKAPKSVKFFQDQALLLRTKMETSEEALKALKKQYNVTSLAEERTLLLQQSSTLRAELNATLSQKVEAEKRIGQMRRQLAATPKTVSQGEVSDQNPYLINTLEARLVELQLEENKLLAKYTDQSRPVTNVREEIRIVKQKLAEQEGKSYGSTSTGLNPTYQNLQQTLMQNEAELNAIKAKAETQQVHLVAYQGQLEKLNRIEVELDQLQQQVDVNRENYRLYLTKLEESRISDAMDSEKITNVSLIEPARAPREPVSPKKMLNLILALFLGAFGGLGLAFFMEYLDDKIEKVEDVEETLDLPVLASVPVMGAINTEEPSKGSGDEKFQL